jgi:arabinoxylan arabinofuranohydrolase
MKKLLVVFLVALVISSTMFFSESQALNPFITSQYAADPSAHVFSSDPNTIYVYPSHDDDNADWFTMWDYHVYSSTDMKKWTDHGVILHINDVPWKPVKWMWAPDCAYNGGKYYFYFCASTRKDSDGNNPKPNDFKIGVAVSDSPTGPFKPEPDGIKDPSDPKGYIWGNDPCVFVDDGGQAYLYWGGQGHGCMEKPKYVKLKSDMKTIDGKPKEISGLPEWYEGCYVHKRKSIYYLSYPTKGPSARIRYATGPSPEGPWTNRGEVIGGTSSWTNHHSFEEFPKGSDKWYAFYQNMDLSGHDKRRSICVDKVYYNSDGTMKKVVQTRTGTGTYAFQRIKAVLYHEQFGTSKEDVIGDIGQCVNWIEDGDWLLYKNLEFPTPTYNGCKLEITYASPYGHDRSCRLVVLNGSNGSLISDIHLPKTGGWQTWRTRTAYLHLPKGMQDIRLVACGRYIKQPLYNLNAFKFDGIGQMEAPKGDMHIQSAANKLYWRLSGQNVVVSLSSPGSLYFTVVDLGDGTVGIKYYSSDNIYVRAEGSNGELKVAKVIDKYSKFIWQNYSDGTFILKNVGTGNYVCLDINSCKLYTLPMSSIKDTYKFIVHLNSLVLLN